MRTDERAGIDSIGMGLLDKFWFRFDEQFREEDALVWTLLTPEGEPFSQWFNLAPLTGEPVLMTLLGGDTAREWTGRSDDEVTAAAMRSLQLFDAGW